MTFCFLRASFLSLLLLVFVLAEIEDLADGGIGLGSDLDQIEAGFGGPGQRLVAGDDADHVAAFIHQAHIAPRRFRR